MIKQTSFFKRRRDLALDDFGAYWRGRHADVVRRIKGLVRYVQNHAVGGDAERGFDGIAEVWFEDKDAMRASAGSPELAAVRADEANFIDADSMAAIICDEWVLKDGEVPPGAAKLMALVSRRADKAPEAFQAIYRDEFGPMVAAVPGVARYVQAHCRPGIYRAGGEPARDAVASLWVAGGAPALATPEMAEVVAFERNFIDVGRTSASWVEEVEIPL